MASPLPLRTPSPASPAAPASPASSPVQPMGSPTRPPIPEDVLTLPLFSFWTGDYLDEEAEWRLHNQTRDSVHDIMLALIGDPLCPRPPTRRLVHRTAESYSGKDYNLDPLDTEIISPSTSSKIKGLVDGCLYGNPTSREDKTAKRINDRPESIILIHEVKPPGSDKQGEFFVPPAAAQDVDRQIRRRANAADAEQVRTRHLYLIAWVGPFFRPYYWLRPPQPKSTNDKEGTTVADEDEAEILEDEIDIEVDPNRIKGTMRPSDQDLILSNKFVVPGPQVSLWCDVREGDNQRLLQQVLMDSIRGAPSFPDMYGNSCRSVSWMSRGANMDSSPSNGSGTSASSGSPYKQRNVQVPRSERQLRSLQ